MKTTKTNRIFVVWVLSLAMVLPAVLNPLHAQTSFAVQYFNPAYAYRHNFNPAFVPQWGYVGFPGIGNLNVSLSSNMGAGSLLYPIEKTGSDGKVYTQLATFLHPDIDAATALNNFRKNNYVNLHLDENIFSAGWFWGRSFWNFSLGVKAGMNLNLPREFFSFLKRGMYADPTRYGIENLSVSAKAYVEAAVGYARELNTEWTVGGKFKFLVGAAEAELAVNRMDIELGSDAWHIQSDANLNVYGRLLDIDFSGDGFIPGFGIGAISPAGYGMAVDLGGEYRPAWAPGLRFSAALTDLGFINYAASSVQRYNAQGEVLFEGLKDIDLNGGFGDVFGDIMEDAKQMINFTESDLQKSQARRTNTALTFAAEYALWNNRFSVGLVNTTVFYPYRTESDLTLVGNLRPCRWFSMSLAYSFFHGNRGMGWALNFTPKWGLNLFIASNYTPLYVNNYFIPIKDARMNIQVGLTIPLGNNRRCTYAAEEFDVNYYPYTFRDDTAHPNRFEGARRSKPDDAEDEDYWEEMEREKREREALMNGTAFPVEPAGSADETDEDGEEAGGKVKPVLEYEFEEAEPAGETPETPVETTVTVEPENQDVILLDAGTGEPQQQDNDDDSDE